MPAIVASTTKITFFKPRRMASERSGTPNASISPLDTEPKKTRDQNKQMPTQPIAVREWTSGAGSVSRSSGDIPPPHSALLREFFCPRGPTRWPASAVARIRMIGTTCTRRLRQSATRPGVLILCWIACSTLSLSTISVNRIGESRLPGEKTATTGSFWIPSSSIRA